MMNKDPVCSLKFSFDTALGKQSVTIDITLQERIIQNVLGNINGAFKLLPKLLLKKVL